MSQVSDSDIRTLYSPEALSEHDLDVIGAKLEVGTFTERTLKLLINILERNDVKRVEYALDLKKSESWDDLLEHSTKLEKYSLASNMILRVIISVIDRELYGLEKYMAFKDKVRAKAKYFSLLLMPALYSRDEVHKAMIKIYYFFRSNRKMLVKLIATRQLEDKIINKFIRSYKTPNSRRKLNKLFNLILSEEQIIKRFDLFLQKNEPQMEAITKLIEKKELRERVVIGAAAVTGKVLPLPATGVILTLLARLLVNWLNKTYGGYDKLLQTA